MLNEEEFAEFCMIMRVVDFMQSNQSMFSEAPDAMAAFLGLQRCTSELFELLDTDERDALLERYREERLFPQAAIK